MPRMKLRPSMDVRATLLATEIVLQTSKRLGRLQSCIVNTEIVVIVDDSNTDISGVGDNTVPKSREIEIGLVPVLTVP